MDFTYSLGYLTVVTGRVFTNSFGRKMAEAGLDVTMEQWCVLRILLNEDGCSQESILLFVQYEKSTLSRVLDGMEKKGLIERRRGKADGRCKEVFLTPKGAEIGAEGTVIVLEGLDKLYAGISPAELDQCRAMLTLMQTRLMGMWHGEDR